MFDVCFATGAQRIVVVSTQITDIANNICKRVNLIIQYSAFLSKELISFPIPLSSPYSRMHISSGLSIITLVDRFDTCNHKSRVKYKFQWMIPYKMQYKATRLLELTPDFGFGGNALHPPSSNI